MKDRLKSSQGDLPSVVRVIMGLIRDSIAVFLQDFEVTKNNTQMRYRIPLLRRLRPQVSPYAVQKIFEQWEAVLAHRHSSKPFPRPCKGAFRRVIGLTYRHKINDAINRNRGEPASVVLRKEDISRH